LTEAARSPDPVVRVHAQRVANSIFHKDSLGSLGTGETDIHHISAAHEIAFEGLKDKNALVQRCAAEAIARHRVVNSSYIVRSLLDLFSQVSPADTHLRYVVRKSIRDQLRVGQVFDLLIKENLSDNDRQALASVSLGVTNAAAATFLLRQLPELTRVNNPSPPIADVLKHAARYAPEDELPRLAEFANQRIPQAYGLAQYQELERQFALFKSVDEGLQQRGRARPESIRSWGTNLVWKFFTALDSYHSWTALTYEANPTAVPWDLETRTGTDGRKRQLTSSLPHGEALTGVLRSKDFDLPARLSFWLCGHDGFPEQPARNVNLVRLRAAGSGEVLASAAAPRNDIARRINWELPARQGQRVFVEAVDGDAGGAYAWIAFGGFEPELSQLRPSEFSPRKMRDWFSAAIDTSVRLQMKEAASVLAQLCTPRPGHRIDESDSSTLGEAARAWVALEPGRAVPVLAGTVATNYGPAAYRESVTEILAAQDTPVAQAAVTTALKSLPYKAQEKIAYTMASSKFSAETLLAGVESGAVAPRVLQRVGVNNRLKSSRPENWEARVAQLTKTLAPANEQLEKLIEHRRKAYDPAKSKPVEGSRLFITHCAACHQIDGSGGLVGPQLSGIGARGLERLCEDVLDPNRNVDLAFRNTMLMLKDGDIVSGLFRREEGELIVLADGTGKEVSIPKANVSERRQSETSLMPENIGEVLSQEDFNHLMAFLLSNDGRVSAGEVVRALNPNAARNASCGA
jgi:putative heme-binding domain-containing protein